MNDNKKAYLVGGGIASLAGAAYLIKDANFSGKNIFIFESSKKFGGSLDAQNRSASEGYVMRGVRMFEEKAFSSTFDLMSFIPSLENPEKTIREIFVDFNSKNKTYSKSRLVVNGKSIDSGPLGLCLSDKLSLIRLMLRPENSFGIEKIEDFFTPSFFKSNFWYEFCTAFAFLPWHSLVEFRRYAIRFIQDFPAIDTLETLEVTSCNQYEAMVLPILEHLKKQGVNFVSDASVNNLDFKVNNGVREVTKIYLKQNGKEKEILVNHDDHVLITLGSITADSSQGSMTQAPKLEPETKGVAWQLWENLASNHNDFGRPAVFNAQVDKSKWTSFSVTLRDPKFFKLMERFVDKKINDFGGVNLVESNWLLSVVLSYKPYFLNQPAEITFCWGYGLFPDKEGNFVKKKMVDCSGEEILTEVCYHLGFEKELVEILQSAICIPCYMPYITSQFLPRSKGDRPLVRPKNLKNLAFIGQYCEMPKDVVFTVEYSIRSAQTAVYSLVGINKKVVPIYNGTHHVRVLFEALKTFFR